jgi:hypothetical protein
MIKIDTRVLLRSGTYDDTLRVAYKHNKHEVYISFKNGTIEDEGYYIVEQIGMNMKLTYTPLPDERIWQPDRNGAVKLKGRYHLVNCEGGRVCRKVRNSTGRSPCIALPTEYARPGQIFRVIKSREENVVWLLRIGPLTYADETSVPPEFLEDRVMKD